MNKELEWSDPQPPTATVKYCHSVAGGFRIECHGDTWRLFFYDALIRVSDSLEDLQAHASTIAKDIAPAGTMDSYKAQMLHNVRVGDSEAWADGWNAAIRLNSDTAGWIRADYHSDRRMGDAPVFILSEKDPSDAWGAKYLPLCVVTDDHQGVAARNAEVARLAYEEGYDDGDSAAQPGVNTELCYSERRERAWRESDTYKAHHHDA